MSWSGAPAAALAALLHPGTFLVSRERALPDAATLASAPNWLRWIIEHKHRHWVKSVYLLTRVEARPDSENGDVLIGVNVTRAKRSGAGSDDDDAPPDDDDDEDEDEDEGVSSDDDDVGDSRPRTRRRLVAGSSSSSSSAPTAENAALVIQRTWRRRRERHDTERRAASSFDDDSDSPSLSPGRTSAAQSNRDGGSYFTSPRPARTRSPPMGARFPWTEVSVTRGHARGRSRTTRRRPTRGVRGRDRGRGSRGGARRVRGRR